MSEQHIVGATTATGPLPDEIIAGGMPDASKSGRVDYANMSTEALLSSFWGYAKHPMSDVATQVVNTLGNGAIAATQGELLRHVIAAIGLRKAFGRMISREQAGSDLGVNLPEGLNPSFTLYLQAIRLKPEDSEDRKLATDFKAMLRKRIRTLRDV